VTVTATNGCGSVPAGVFAVSALQVPGAISGPNSPCKSLAGGYLYSVPNTPGVSYEWMVSYSGAHFVGTHNGSSVMINFTGVNAAHNPITISVRAKVEGCSSAWVTRTVTVSLGCREMDPNAATASSFVPALNAYPNPTSGKLNVTFNTNAKEKYTLKVVDVIGNELIRQDNTATEGLNSLDLDLTGVAKGMYFISVESVGTETQTMRIVVE
jgi:hypothetical protein